MKGGNAKYGISKLLMDPYTTEKKAVRNTHVLPAEALLSTLASGPSGKISDVPSDIPSSSAATLPPRATVFAISRPLLTQVALLWMGQLAHSVDRCVARIAVCECGQVATEELTALKATIAALRRDVDQRKSTDM
uniref:Integrase core domain containing protein n=1 Tax=Solanum tuberosum TaxID=4113 RepID=M1DSC0_SOLTU